MKVLSTFNLWLSPLHLKSKTCSSGFRESRKGIPRGRGGDRRLSWKSQYAECAGEKGKSMLPFGKERVIDSRWGDKDQLPGLGVITPTKLQ